MFYSVSKFHLVLIQNQFRFMQLLQPLILSVCVCVYHLRK